MLKADKEKIELLISKDENQRVNGAEQLAALDVGHFEDHPFSTKFIKEREKDLIAAYRYSRSSLVKEWVLQSLAGALIESDHVVEMVSESLTKECQYLPTLLYYMWQSAKKFFHCKENIKALCQHPDPQVRWRCALVLEQMPLDYDSDIEVIRTLMVDNYYTTRTYAVLALKKLNKLSMLDKKALKQVVKIDDGAARTYAKELLGQ